MFEDDEEYYLEEIREERAQLRERRLASIQLLEGRDPQNSPSSYRVEQDE